MLGSIFVKNLIQNILKMLEFKKIFFLPLRGWEKSQLSALEVLPSSQSKNICIKHSTEDAPKQGVATAKDSCDWGQGWEKTILSLQIPTLILELLLSFFFYQMHAFPSLNKLNFSKIKK